MLSVTKIFRFETAHAIHQYPGACAHIHGHSYELHVRVASRQATDDFVAGLGIVLDFKELKEIVRKSVVEKLDHKLVLSANYLAAIPIKPYPELVILPYEPTAENMLLFIKKAIAEALPAHIRLCTLQLWETSDSYAEWSAS